MQPDNSGLMGFFNGNARILVSLTSQLLLDVKEPSTHLHRAALSSGPVTAFEDVLSQTDGGGGNLRRVASNSSFSTLMKDRLGVCVVGGWIKHEEWGTIGE